MAHSFFGNIIEFLIGFFVLSALFSFILTFVLALIWFELGQIILYTKVIEGIIIIILFFKRKALALGYLFSFLLNLIGVYGLISGAV